MLSNERLLILDTEIVLLLRTEDVSVELSRLIPTVGTATLVIVYL